MVASFPSRGRTFTHLYRVKVLQICGWMVRCESNECCERKRVDAAVWNLYPAPVQLSWTNDAAQTKTFVYHKSCHAKALYLANDSLRSGFCIPSPCILMIFFSDLPLSFSWLPTPDLHFGCFGASGVWH